jgi:hypothetical protein
MHEKASYSYFTEYGLFHYKPSEFRVLLGLFTLNLALLLSVYYTALITSQIVQLIAYTCTCLPNHSTARTRIALLCEFS